MFHHSNIRVQSQTSESVREATERVRSSPSPYLYSGAQRERERYSGAQREREREREKRERERRSERQRERERNPNDSVSSRVCATASRCSRRVQLRTLDITADGALWRVCRSLGCACDAARTSVKHGSEREGGGWNGAGSSGAIK
jgi:hypothetical protein